MPDPAWPVIRFGVARMLLVLAIIVLPVTVARPAAAQTTRERTNLDAGWRFHHGDPKGNTIELRYDLRPDIGASDDGKSADTEPEAAAPKRPANTAILKPWILPTANAFILDPTSHHQRPAGDPGATVPFVQAGFDDTGWQPVTLPHDWAIAGPFLKTGPYGGMGRLPSWGIGWYRRALDIAKADAGKSVFLDIDGAMSYATVWLNGQLVGGWPYGYNSWRLDLTPYVVPGGANQLAIRLDNPPESSRWYPGGGLYRDVWLVKTDPVHVGHWGTRITTPDVSAKQARVTLAVSIDNDGDRSATVSLASSIYAIDAGGKPIGKPVASIAPADVTIASGSSQQIDGKTIIANPLVWGPPPAQQPNLYVAVTRIMRAGRTIDTVETRFGIRTLRFDANEGLFVNGQHVRIQGVNNHHDLGAIGAAFNARAAERQLEILREMGVNAIRTSHNPPAAGLLDLADRMGFLVMDEIFDSWQRKKTPLDFHLIFDDWHEADLRAMLRRDRNHPSIIMWSVGNEVGEQNTGEAGAKIAQELVDIVHQEDATRPATTAMNWAKPDMPLPATVDVIALNYQGTGVRTLPGQFDAFHKAFPNKMIIASESASALSSRGEYLFPVSGSLSGPVRPGSGGDPDIKQVSAYELHAADFGSTPDRDFAAFDQHPFVAGEFVWSGFDYLGEPTPYYDARSSYNGIVDLAGFPKDRFYLYQARWRPDLKFVHVLPHWTWPGREGEVTPVFAITSGDEAELFVNGKSQGRQIRAPYAYRFRWDYVKYAPGEIKVVAYKNGKEWATGTIATAGPPASLDLAPDRTRILAEGADLAYVALTVVDAKGAMAPRASNLVTFSIEGPGEIIATDNGDPTDFEPFPSPRRKAFNGRATVIVRTIRGKSGKIIVRAKAPALKDATVTLESVPHLTKD